MDKKSTEGLPRLDTHQEVYNRILPLCRLARGEIWTDPVAGHKVGVLDAAAGEEVSRLCAGQKAGLVIADPPYNVKVGARNTKNLSQVDIAAYLDFSRAWISNLKNGTAGDCHLYIWLGADYKQGFQPLPEIMLLMREFPGFKSRNYISLRNQRGYGTQRNWMWVRQELLHYIKGEPFFKPVYTDIPKILKGYYKDVAGKRTENLERSKSGTIRPGNIWVDIQQVFYRMQENVPGCYAQKPLKAIERIIGTSAEAGAVILDLFTHSGTALVAGERLGCRVFALDNDPVFAEIAIRRLEHLRQTGRTGWQWQSPFPEFCC